VTAARCKREVSVIIAGAACTDVAAVVDSEVGEDVEVMAVGLVVEGAMIVLARGSLTDTVEMNDRKLPFSIHNW
jgi:hypothetical protein